MKEFLIFLLLAASVFSLIIMIDLVMHYSINGIISKEFEPFDVTEQTEIVILSLFVVYFIVKAVLYFIKKKQNGPANQNESN